MEHNFPRHKVRSYVHSDFLKKVQYRNGENKCNFIVLKPNTTSAISYDHHIDQGQYQ